MPSAAIATFTPPAQLVFVSDDNYPPYLFRTADGRLQGILKDKWELWSRTTGIPVKFNGMEWTKAQESLRNGTADVLGAVTYTEERLQLYEFSPPWATIEARVYFHQNISGINDVASMRGFTIGAKESSACAEWLVERGITPTRPYATSEALVRAAGSGEVRLFCMDAPTAQYFLFRQNLASEFRQTAPLYTAGFHWAVAKGRIELRDFISHGFDRIPAGELRKIDDRWLGSPLKTPLDPRYYTYFAALAAAILAAITLLVLWNRTLRLRVVARTAELDGQNRAFELIAKGAPMRETLDALARTIEDRSPGMLCSILLLDTDGTRVRHGAAPSLPDDFHRAIDGEAIGPRAGSCGTAAFRREQVVTEDIETDPLWEDYRGLAAQYGLRACWATPIFDAQRRVLGTFAMYFREPRRPDQGHLRLIEMATHTAAIAILKQREKDALRESEARVRLAVHASNIGLWDWDIAADRVYYSPEWTSQLGYRHDEISDRFEEWESRLHPEDRARVLLELKAYLASPVGSHEVEIRLRHRDGSYRWIYSRAQVEVDGTGRVRRMLGCHLDITERKRAEEAREALSRRNQSLVAALGEIVYEWRPGTDELSWEGDYTKLLGYSTAEMGSTTESWTSRVHPDDLERVLAEVDQSTRERRNYDLEYRFRHRDGTYAWMHDRGVTFVSPEGTLVRIIGVFVDITERKQAEDRLRELANELRRLSQRLIEIEEIERRRINRELHDQIGANLSALTLELELIRKRLSEQSPAEIRERLDDASRLVSEVVQHARNVMADLRPPALDDYGLLAALRAYAEPLSIRIGIPISVGGDEILPRPSAAAETALFRVAQEALNNAAKHARAGRLDVTLMADERRVKLMVADNGIGFDWTGLSPAAEAWGLRTMRERAAALDADFTIESEPGKGTRVTVELTRGGA